MGDIPVLAFLDRKILNSLSNRIIYKGLCGGGYIDLTYETRHRRRIR